MFNYVLISFIQRKMSRIVEIFSRYPLLRGMVSYSLIWPTSAFIQQKIAGKSWGKIKDSNHDNKRFAVYFLNYNNQNIIIYYAVKIQLTGQNV